MTDDDQPVGPGDDGPFGYRPTGGAIFVLLLVLTTTAVLFISVAGYAYQRVGVSPTWFDAILIGSFVGSRIDLPVWRLPDRARVESVDVVAFGVRYKVPAVHHTGSSVVAVNVGGAIIPTALSVYLIVHDHIWQHSLIAIVCVAVAVWIVARPVPGVGIVTPSLLPPAAAALAAIIIGKPAEAALAYICGTIGTLIGADLMNLPRIRDLRAPVASIGGAGTFDGIFLAGLLAVVIATL